MSILWRVCFNFVYKVLIFPTVLFGISTYCSRIVSFRSKKSRIALTSLFVVIGVVADETILPRYGNIKSTIQGSIFISVVTWLSQILFRRNHVTWCGAILIGVVLGICELPMHAWILKNHK